MTPLDLSALTRPLSKQDPCGPDLEAEDDDDYLNAIVTAETVLPSDYYVFSDYIGMRQPFDLDRRYSDLDLGAQIGAVAAFFDRTRDLRLSVLLTKLCLLAKSLGDARICIESIAVLLEERWSEVHPRAENGSYALRRDVLQRLDDALIVTALQHIPVFTNKRHGAITWQRYTAELKKGAGGSGDEVSDFDRMLADEGQTDLSVLLGARDDIEEGRAKLAGLAGALKRIRAACAAGMEDGPPSLPALNQVVDRLTRFVERVYQLIEAAVVRLDPTAAHAPAPLSEEAEPENLAPVVGRPPAPGLDGPAEAAAALAAATTYFERAEPSNPALLLLRQAYALIGKSFLDAMQILMPDHAAKATLDIGSVKTFALPLARLASIEPVAASSASQAQAEAGAPWPAVRDRVEAVALLDQVSAYFRRAEPSSPVPMLVDGARALTGKDFMSLLGDLLPKDALKAALAPK